MKSARAYDLIADQGTNSMESTLSSTDHLMTRPLVVKDVVGWKGGDDLNIMRWEVVLEFLGRDQDRV
jgi:hypothetical protein